MYLLSLHSTKYPLQLSTISCSHRPFKTIISAKIPPARDRIIDFGKFKGKLLGTLPSTYLKWVSRNLRARDLEEWAKLADEVLDDPVYKDRIEWEFAEKLLNGEVLVSPLVKENHSAVSELLEMSERFGWDNENKVAWNKIDFKLLGTSKGGRIPRVHDNRSVVKNVDPLHGDLKRLGALQSTQVKKKNEVKVRDNEVEERRKERRERLRLNSSCKSLPVERLGKIGIEDNDKGSFEIGENVRLKGDQAVFEERVVEIQSRFPGREGLLRKVLNRKRV